MPISLHKKNSLDNAKMAKYKAKPRHRGIIRIMRPKVVLKILEGLGVTITQRTLQKYAKAGLIPKPETKPAGRGKGKITEYEPETPAEVYAAWLLLNEYKRRYEYVKIIRDKAKEIEGTQAELQMFFDNFLSWTREDWLVNEWLTEKAKILSGLKPEDEVLIDTTDFWTFTPGGKRIRKLKKG